MSYKLGIPFKRVTQFTLNGTPLRVVLSVRDDLPFAISAELIGRGYPVSLQIVDITSPCLLRRSQFRFQKWF